jgi:hypothetical protein
VFQGVGKFEVSSFLISANLKSAVFGVRKLEVKPGLSDMLTFSKLELAILD